MERDLPIPDFLNEDADTIHERMLEKAPPDVNTMEGDFFWDATRPAAEELAQLKQLQLQNIIKLPFVQTSYEEYLEFIGEEWGVFRKPAINSTGLIKVIGKPNTIIEEGKIVSTIATDRQEGIEFEFVETKTIDDTGSIYVKAQCIQAGTIGNVVAGSITQLITPINGVESVINEVAFNGGVDTESDEAFRERIIKKMQTPATSGNIGHYKIWSTNVNGVGDAIVIPTWNGPGTVKVIILDSNKRTPSREIINNVIANIEENRPIGAIVTVEGATEIPINISVNVQLATGADTEQMKQQIEDGARTYLESIAYKETLVRYTRIANVILDIPLVIDYTDLTVNGGTSNIEIPVGSVAVIGTVVVNSGD